VTCHVVPNGALFCAASLVTPTTLREGLAALFPIHEISAVYQIMDEFIHEPCLLRAQVARLLFITFHIQVGIGYLGIDFLKREQERRNQLVRMDMGIEGNDDEDDDDNDNRDEGSITTDSARDG
jgi:hypothetical protein